MPAPRLINLIWFRFIDGKEDEDKVKIRKELKELPITHPFLVKRQFKITSTPRVDPKKIESSTVEQQKVTPTRQKLGTNTGYVPPWYLGEREAFKRAKKNMVGVQSLPKSK